MKVSPTGARTVRTTTVLDAPPERVWELVLRPATLRHIAWPLLRLPELEGREARWVQGETVRTRLLVLGVIPFSRHRLTLERLDPVARVLQSDEGGGVIRTWRHRITVEPQAPGRSRYTDVVEVDAGIWTGPVAVLASGFYRWRQHRWRGLVAR